MLPKGYAVAEFQTNNFILISRDGLGGDIQNNSRPPEVGRRSLRFPPPQEVKTRESRSVRFGYVCGETTQAGIE